MVSPHIDMPNNQKLTAMIAQLIESTLKKKPGSVNPDDPLFSSKDGFDSFSLMEFVLQLEETFDMSIPDDDLDPDIFHSMNTIMVYLSDKLESQDLRGEK